MLTEIVHRLLGKARGFNATGRTEVCPPAMLHGVALSAAGWRAGLRDWLGTGWQSSLNGSPREVAGRAEPSLGRVSEDFQQALHDIRTQQAGMLQDRIRIARSLRELWHLRPEVFRLVALHYSQSEAQCRLDRLNRHFPTRSPRSGFAPLDAPSSPEPRPAARR